ncbi:MAG TPA: hypothetical protein VIW24_28130 [Aldersonia sp.]
MVLKFEQSSFENSAYMAKPSSLPYRESAMDILDVLAERTRTDFSVVQGNRDVAYAMLLRIQVVGENLSKVRSLFPEIYDRHSSDSWNRLIRSGTSSATGTRRLT